MAKSYRGKEVDMISLAKKYEKAVALGNAKMNGKGDILGRGGKVVKTREEIIAESKLSTVSQEATVNLKETAIKEVEKELAEIDKEVKENVVEKLNTRKVKTVKSEVNDENNETKNESEVKKIERDE